MRRTAAAGLLAGVVLCSTAPVSLGASYEYLTTYSGVYDWTQKYVAAPGKPDGLQTKQHYGWADFEYLKVVAKKDGTYKQTHTRFIAAQGKLNAVNTQGSAMAGGPFVTTTDCTIRSALTPKTYEFSGANAQPIPVSQNPLLNLAWEIPDYGSAPATDAPPFTVTGMTDTGPCSGAYTSHFLTWTPASTNPTVFTNVPATQKLRDAVAGTTSIHYDEISNGKVFRRTFRNASATGHATRPGFDGDSVEDAAVKIDASVTFQRIDGNNRPNKIGALLLAAGFGGLDHQGPDGGPAGASGQDEEIIIPGLGRGEVTLDVTGNLATNRRSLRAGGATVLASGSGSGGRIVRLTLKPTAAGSALADPHPAIQARWVERFRPHGSKRTYTASKPFTIPARD